MTENEKSSVYFNLCDMHSIYYQKHCSWLFEKKNSKYFIACEK